MVDDTLLFRHVDETQEPLDLGWSQDYGALHYHFRDACYEQCQHQPYDVERYATFSKGYYNDILSVDDTKLHDFCFIGSIDSSLQDRQWVIDFAKAHFTSRSFFINTDINTVEPTPYVWEPLGEYDHTLDLETYPRHKPKSYHEEGHEQRVQVRYVPHNLIYFQTMRQSEFVLCPRGDSSWSFRFYEVLMCESLPIVASWHDTYRNRAESTLNYQYVLANQPPPFVFNRAMVEMNTTLFRTFHLLPDPSFSP
jgi:hypothetical protein